MSVVGVVHVVGVVGVVAVVCVVCVVGVVYVVGVVAIVLTNQKHNPDLGSDMSTVWNFCSRSSDVISLGNQW